MNLFLGCCDSLFGKHDFSCNSNDNDDDNSVLTIIFIFSLAF